mmetsp:Transcript_97435/g.297720  ORF Transcript_97435/g.297720 Transcript_97435/m.297720 type:complete len:229 (-) Transcript_97435:137-823(-)
MPSTGSAVVTTRRMPGAPALGRDASFSFTALSRALKSRKGNCRHNHATETAPHNSAALTDTTRARELSTRAAYHPKARGTTNFAVSSTRFTRLFSSGSPLACARAGATRISKLIEVNSLERSAAEAKSTMETNWCAGMLAAESAPSSRKCNNNSRQLAAPAACPATAMAPNAPKGAASAIPPRKGEAINFTPWTAALNVANGNAAPAPPSKATKMMGTAKPRRRAPAV